MTRRWSILLPVLNVVVASALIVQDEILTWRYLPALEREEDADRRKTTPERERERAEGEAIGWEPCREYRPRLSVAFVQITNLPAMLLLGWYRPSPSLRLADSSREIAYENEPVRPEQTGFVGLPSACGNRSPVVVIRTTA